MASFSKFKFAYGPESGLWWALADNYRYSYLALDEFKFMLQRKLCNYFICLYPWPEAEVGGWSGPTSQHLLWRL